MPASPATQVSERSGVATYPQWVSSRGGVLVRSSLPRLLLKPNSGVIFGLIALPLETREACRPGHDGVHSFSSGRVRGGGFAPPLPFLVYRSCLANCRTASMKRMPFGTPYPVALSHPAVATNDVSTPNAMA